MPKKATIGILVASAFLTLACLCCPASIFTYAPTSRPNLPSATLKPTVSPAPTFSPILPIEPATTNLDIPACVDHLAQILDESENSYYPGQELRSDFVLVTYTISGDSITAPVFVSPLPADLRTDQQDTARQEEMWSFVAGVVPADQRMLLTKFVVFTDGTGNSLGAVETLDNPHDWALELDIEDARHFPDLSTTLIHEFGHLLTLNDAQITPDFRVFYNPDDPQIYEEEAATCSTYFLFKGCSRPDSYLNTFFQRFWTDIYTEWQIINTETDEDILGQKMDRFYQRYSDQFVSDYAVTSPEEDIAETFMYFIFTPKPSGASIAEQKRLFFYDYPEMVALRERLLQNLCPYAEEYR
jgi:hypothetical protein